MLGQVRAYMKSVDVVTFVKGLCFCQSISEKMILACGERLQCYSSRLLTFRNRNLTDPIHSTFLEVILLVVRGDLLGVPPFHTHSPRTLVSIPNP